MENVMVSSELNFPLSRSPNPNPLSVIGLTFVQTEPYFALHISILLEISPLLK